MASDLYEILGLHADATPEEVRKAYKRKALQTHPDRIPNSSASQKSHAEEQFRKVNNAYEVLNDPQKRRTYDLHGVWPPPQPDVSSDMPYNASGSSSRPRGPRASSGRRSRTYDETFNHAHYTNPFASFNFSDPFSIFDSVFGDATSGRGQQASGMPGIHIDDQGGIRIHIGLGMSSQPMNFQFSSSNGNRYEHTQMRRSTTIHGGSPQVVSDTTTTQTINGVSQSIRKRRDADGNEYVTRTYPDGRKIRTVNGIEQPTSRPPVAQPQAQPLPVYGQPQPSRTRHHTVPVPTSRHVVPPPQPTMPAQHIPGPQHTESARPESIYSAHKVRHRTQSNVSARDYEADLSENEPRWKAKEWLKRKHVHRHKGEAAVY